jgi:delta 1-pyrroline-5-carboxylate dehydrogenase
VALTSLRRAAIVSWLSEASRTPQPFGGSGLSGTTRPKAGGPHDLRRFALEQVVTVNTAAAGGNAALLAEDE